MCDWTRNPALRAEKVMALQKVDIEQDKMLETR
jgi:hypothetical protein